MKVHDIVAEMLLPAMVLLHMFYEVFLADKITSLVGLAKETRLAP